ncbi:MAG: tape measure protein [Prevotella sp.]|nr:tape measure protein [Prevotella sp.]
MEEVKIPITIDDSGFGAGTKRIIDRMEDTQKEVNKTGMSVDYFAKHMQNVYRHFDKLTAAVHENTAAIGKDSQATRQLGRDFEETTDKGVSGFGRLEKAAIGFFTIQKAKEFVGNVYDVRSEIEKLETSFRILVGDKAKADALFASIRKFAVETPMQLKDLAGAAQTMMGFGIATEDVMENLQALGNVSMGDSQKFQSLALAFSQMSATGKLMGQDLLQMINAGFNPLDQMAKTTGKSIAELKEEMSQGAISADMVRQAFIDATSEGGKFNGMLEAQSKTLAGAYSNLEGAVDDMLNEIGQKSEGAFATAIEGATDLVKNYDKVASIIQDLIVAYGSYKAALMVCNAVEKASVGIKQAMAVQEALLTAEAKKLAAARGISLAAAKAELGGVNLLTVAKIRLTAATKSLTAAMMANPYVLVSMAVAGLCFGIYKLATAEDAETAARRRANEEMKTFQDQLDEQKNKIQGYIQTLQDSNATEYQKAEAWEMLNKMAPTLTEKYDRATIATMDLAKANKELTEQAEQLNYEHLKQEVAKWSESLKKAKEAEQNYISSTSPDPNGVRAKSIGDWLTEAETKLDEYAKKLAEVNRIRAKMAEDNKPLEIRIQEANENAEAKAEIYNFYKRAADLAGELKTAHDIAAGTIANSSIPQDYEAIADSARQKYDDLIAELEKDVEDLRTKIAESPASLELDRELKGKEQALNDLLQMKREWEWSGATTIPLTFQWNFSQVENALRAAQSGVGKNTEGMKWVTDYVSQAGGHWEKDDAHADTRTAAQWRQQAYGNWKKAQKAVDEFWQKKESMDKASFDKEYDRLKGIADQAKKDYDKLKGPKGGNTNKKDPAVERAKRQQEYLALIEKQRVEQERATRDMELSTAQAEIDAMDDGAKKTLAQISLNFEKQQEEIERGYADLKQKKIEAAKRLWDADPKNKNSVFDPSKVNTNYTATETENYQARLAASMAEYVRAIAEMDIPDLPQSYIQDRIQEIKSAYEREIKAIQEEEAKLKESQGGSLSQEQSDDYVEKYAAAHKKMSDKVKALEKAEVERGKKKYKQLLNDFKSYDQKRRDLEKKYTEDMAIYQAQRDQIVKDGGDTTEIDESIAERTRQYKKDVQDLQNDILTASDFYTKLFADVSEKGYKALRDFYRQAKETLDKAKVMADGVEIEIPVKDANGNFVKKAVKVTVDEFQKMQKQVKVIRDEMDKDNPFAAFKDAWKELKDSMKKDGDVSGSLTKLNEKGKELTSTINGWGDSLGAVFGERFSKSIDEAMTMVNGVMDMGTGIAQIYSGDIVGGISNTLSGLSSIVSMFTSWKEKMEEMRRQWYIAEIETARELRKEHEEYAGIRSTISDIIKGQEELNWLIAKGFAKPSSVSLWEAQNEQLQEYKNNLAAEQRAYDDLWNKLQGSRGYYEWGNSMNGGSEEWSLRGYSTEQIKLWYNQDKLSGAARDYYEAWVESGKTVEELRDHIEECYAAMQEMVMGMNFDSFLSSVKSNLQEARGDVSKFAEFTEDTIVDALLNAFMYQELAKMVEPLYNELSEALIDGRADEDFIRNWKENYIKTMGDATKRLEEISAAAGVDVFSDGGTADSKEYFESLRDMWLSTLTDMEADGEAWKKEILRVMFEDLVSEAVLGEDFEAWLEEWKKAYREAVEAGDEERLTRLLEEQVAKRDELAKRAQDIADGLGYTGEAEDAKNAFSDIKTTFIDTLMDMDADAESWGEKIRETLLREMVEKTIVESMGLGAQMEAFGKQLLSYITDDTLTDESRQQNIDAVLAEMESSFGTASELVRKMRDALGIGKDGAKAESPFKNLRQSFLNELLNMEADAEDFRRTLDKTLVQDMIEKFVLDVRMTINGQDFENFDAYLEDWNRRYLEIFQDGELTKEQKESQLQALIDELMAEREALDAASADLRERLKEIEESIPDTTFKEMSDSWVNTLMDMDATAEDWAKDIGRTMARKIVEQMVQAQMIQPLLDQLQEAFNTAMSAEGATWQSVLPLLVPYIDQIKTAFGDMQPMVEQILNAFGIFKEVEEEVKDGFGDLRSTFVSSLMDMEADADKFAKDIARIMTEQMVNKIIEQQFQSQIDALSAEWYDALESGDTDALERIRQKVIELQKACGSAVQPLLDDLKEIEYVEEVEVDETITSMRDSWLSALMDMKAGTQDFVNDIKKLLTQKLVEKFVLNAQFDSWLEGIQSKYDSILGSGMSEREMADAMGRLAAEWEEKAREMQEQTQRIFDLTGWSAIVEQMNSPLADLRSSFRSSLMDMESDTEAFTSDISKLLTEAFIDKFVLGDEFDKRLAEWQEQYASIMRGNYSEEDRASLLKQLQQAIAAAKEGYAEEAQAIQDLMGTGQSSDQNATMNMADKATYEQFETYLGIAVAQQMATLQGNEVRQQILATLRGMTGITTPGGETVREIRSLLNTTNEYLLDIKRSNRAMLDQFGSKIDNIIGKLTRLV